ncbi:MAG: GMC family oxidoreductase N-terminal domain-containing protein [Gemmatimonadetes bacterium]|nr:GMC family oxidoreductase N-terminal domain-containing protein [Gemmatimonadota bacterium]
MTDRLPARERETLMALAEVIAPVSAGGGPGAGTLGTALDARFAALPLRTRKELRQALGALGQPLLRFALCGELRPWATLSPERRAACFARLGASRLPLARVLHEAVRRLVLSTYYSGDAALQSLGIGLPLHQRPPAVSWEGPMAGPEGGVVARGDRTVPPPAPPPSGIRRGAITPGTELVGNFRFRADAVVIGSGAGGAIVAARLAAAGREVLILEAGSRYEPAERTEQEATMLPRLMAESATRATTDLSIPIFQGATVGGGTSVNWMIMLRTPDHVLDEWQRRFGLRDLTPAALAPEFARIEAELSVGQVPDDAHSPSNRLLLDGARRLGWHAIPARVNARGCQRAGTCSSGCRYDARRGAAQVYLPIAFAHGARLLADTRAERVRVVARDGGSGEAPRKEVDAVAHDPRTGEAVGTITVEAPIVVVAAGAVETPALLQRSSLGGGAVGRWLRLHPTTAVMGVYAEETNPLAGMPLTAMMDEFTRTDANGYGFWIECPALGPALAAVSMPGFGAAHATRMLALHRTAPFHLPHTGRRGPAHLQRLRDGGSRGSTARAICPRSCRCAAREGVHGGRRAPAPGQRRRAGHDTARAAAGAPARGRPGAHRQRTDRAQPTRPVLRACQRDLPDGERRPHGRGVARG